MNEGRRPLASALVVLVLMGLVPSTAPAQQPAPPAVQPSQPTVVEVMPPEAPAPGPDIYDVGAGVLTVARIPFNVAICALGGVASLTLFAITLGSAYRATTRVFEEGCAQRWVLRGDDIRPRGRPGVLPEGSYDSYSPRR
jgi:hypothetical protein